MNKNEMVASKARVRFMELVRQTGKGRRFFIRHASGSSAVLLSEKEYESLVATRRLFNDPGRMERIRKARMDIAKGKGGNFDELLRGAGHMKGSG